MPKEIEVKTILNKTKRRDPWFLDDYTLNLYSSCSFNCLYCYIRGSKYGENLEDSISAKMNAIELLEKQLHLRSKKNQYGIIVVSSATDPYLKLEEQYRLTRQALELVARYKFSVHIITKSDLVVRDLDILDEIDKTAIIPSDLQGKLKRGTIISFSFSTLNDRTAKIFEPGETSPSARLEACKAVKENGFLSGISLMPLIPYISDTTENLHLFFKTFKELNADYVMPATITLFGNDKSDSKTLVLNAIKKHFPELQDKYEKLFNNSNELPYYYRKAFYEKMKELSREYGMKDRII
ncbi:MAG: radical SAM protein [Sporocytophaga sp.]|uniref:SPL family radical SAM protein n=1 Tax=Sporocytophaga sp. TaxID=2231183 RepID=UPI001B07D81F|nr:radical SAM protein [Sporocytophaga sp.]MBO9702160.1 radical SAM protein [Sporocytophaga sp.]